MPVVNPDQFTGTDTQKLQACFDVLWKTTDPLKVILDREYRVEQTIAVRAPLQPNVAKPYGRVWIDGFHAEVKWYGTTGAAVFKLGEPNGQHKLWWSQVDGLRITRGPGSCPVFGYDAALVNALHLRDCNGYGIKCTGLTNYLTLDRCFFGGTPDAPQQPAADIWGNLVRVIGGKYQQAGIGIKAHGASVEIDGVDVSLCTEAGVYLDQVGGGRLSGYAEAMGPRAAGNTAAVVRARNSRWFKIDGMLINCVNGSTGSGTHAGFGVDLVGCDHFTIDHGEVQMPTIAGIRLDKTCGDGNTVRRGAHWIPDPQWPQARFIDDASNKLHVER